jgi:competence protein ComFC
MLEIILDIIAPSRCIACGAPVGFRAFDICGACMDKISLLRDQCPVCSGFLSEGRCRICAERTFYPSSNISIAEYRGVTKELLRRLKFHGNRCLHIPAGLLAMREISRRRVRADVITCVPMNARKKWKRGFNQSELIARLIAKQTGAPYRSLLKEKNKTVTQRELGLRHRFINVINRYQVRERADLKDKSIMIIDDVFTTGATINECARVLRAAGAKDVFSVTIARSSMHRLEKS